MTITFVTAFFDIQRDKKGDGRSIDEYLEWIKKTLQLNANLYIVTEKKFISFMKEHRPSGYATHIIEDTLENACYYKYLPVMKHIMESREYKSRIAYPDRVECKLPEYNIIQYSKFGWLERAIIENPFKSKAFFWMDIGISRFFGNIPLQLPYPNENKIDAILQTCKKGFVIQQRQDLQTYTIDANFIWKADNLFKGGMFGGIPHCVLEVKEKLEKIFITMLNNHNVNNEQLALALLWKKEPSLFSVIPDIHRHPCILLHMFV